MADRTGIEWTDATWNPVRGCSRVSEGCRNCYAEKVANRFKKDGEPYAGLIAKGGQWNGSITLVDHLLDQPLKWKKPRRIFVNSMSDLFHENVPFDFIDRVFAVMALSPQHTFQILTKRPEAMLEYFTTCPAHQINRIGAIQHYCDVHYARTTPDHLFGRWPLPNVWLGVSVEDQKTANERIPLLLQTPAAVRWISAEPLLGPISMRWLPAWPENAPTTAQNPYNGGVTDHLDGLRRLDWVVVGGESGTGARPMHPDWARSLRDQCQAAGVPFLFKQWGEWIPWEPDAQPPFFYSQNGGWIDGHHLPDADDHGPEWEMDGGADWIFQRVGKKAAGRTLDGRTWDEYPNDSYRRAS